MTGKVQKFAGQELDIFQVLADDGATRFCWVSSAGQFYGALGNVVVPEVTVEGDSSDASTNRTRILDALNAAIPGAIVRLPNAKFFCDQITITPANSQVVLEGGPNTLMINPGGGGSVGPRMIFAQEDKFGYISTVSGFTPGEEDVSIFTVHEYSNGNPANYQGDAIMYLWPEYFRQTVAQGRLCEMHTIDTVDDGEITLVDDETVSTTMGATVIHANLSGGSLISIDIVSDSGTGYYRTGPAIASTTPRVHFTGDGSGTAEAVVYLDAPVHSIDVTDHGHDYDSADPPMIGFTGGSGSGAAADPIIDDMTGHLVGIRVTNGGSHYQGAPTVSISGGSGADALAVAKIGPSKIHSFHINAGGSGYTTISATVDPPPFLAVWTKDSAKVDSTSGNSVTLTPMDRAANFVPDSWAFLCKGLAFNQLDGRYFRVRSADPDTGVVTFDQPVREDDFIEYQTCLIPGPFIENLTLRNLKVGGLGDEAGIGAIFITGGVNLTLENVHLVAGGEDLVPDSMQFTECQDVRILNCSGNLQPSTSNTFSIVDSDIPGYATHSFCRNFKFTRCFLTKTVTAWFSSVNFRFENCTLEMTGTDTLTATDSENLTFVDCTLRPVEGYYWIIDGPGLRIQDSTIQTGSIEIRSGCYDCILENVTIHSADANSIVTGSTGRYANIRPDPAPINNWTTNPAIYEFKRAMGVNPNHWIELGNIVGSESNVWIRLAMAMNTYGTVSKLYQFTMCHNDTTFPTNTWFAIQPISDSGPGIYYDPHDFAVEAKRGSDEKLYLRVRRIAGAADAAIGTFRLETNGDVELTEACGCNSGPFDPWPDQTAMAMARLPTLSSAPANPSSGNCLLFVTHNSGTEKDELRARFASGSSVLVVSEP